MYLGYIHMYIAKYYDIENKLIFLRISKNQALQVLYLKHHVYITS